MTQVLAATSFVFRDRDLFIHDGSKLRRFRVSAPVQAVLFVILLALVASGLPSAPASGLKSTSDGNCTGS